MQLSDINGEITLSARHAYKNDPKDVERLMIHAGRLLRDGYSLKSFEIKDGVHTQSPQVIIVVLEK